MNDHRDAGEEETVDHGKTLNVSSSEARAGGTIPCPARVTQPADLPAFEKWWFEYKAKITRGMRNRIPDFSVAGRR
ncbi:MAG TPA: hypothetical protein VLT16_16850 [Candidatus Limnocylindrales bacterium]|nr:hypothetical protein [Candidatus Limnocylindrales bacterium]